MLDTPIAAALTRLRAAVANRAGFGRGSATSVTDLNGVVRAEAHEKEWTINAELGQAFGGTGSAPNPGALVRAGLGGCLAIGYQLHAAELGIELTGVRVTVESESDVRGMLDPDADVPPGPIALRYHVEIDSPARPDELARLVDHADRLSPVLDMLTRAQHVERTVAIGALH